MIVLFRSCGGLGNQLYQLLFCNLISNKYNSNNIIHYHSSNYDRYSDWEVPIEFVKAKKIFHILLIKMRIPMLLYKLGWNKTGYFKVCNIILVDSYFQKKDFFLSFSKIEISNSIEFIKGITILHRNLIINKCKLFHFRLGDFFENEIEEVDFVRQSLLNIEVGSTVISNRDDLFNNISEFISILQYKKCIYINSSHLNGVELLNIFYQYRIVHSNGSSLSFFANTLSNSTMLPISEFTNSYQTDLFKRLKELKDYINN